jgi:FtsH-binding integral membrane protein
MMTTAEIEYVPVGTRKEERRSRAGRKSNEERARRATEAEKAARRAKRIYADTPKVLALLLGLVALLAIASFSVSFSGLYAAAAWAVGNVPALQVAVPVMLDVAIIAFTLALFVERERGDKVMGTWIAIAIFATVSAASNVLHTLQVSTALNVPQLIVGAIVSGGAPLLLAFSTDKAGVKVFSEVER